MNEHIYNAFMHEDMLTDRTALDGLVYTSYLCAKGKVDINTMNHVRGVFAKVWPMYDYVFYIEPEFDIVNDGIRSVDVEFRDTIASLFELTIEKNELSMHRVKGSVRNRVNTIIEYLEGR
jgi:hypothetical protein